MNLAKYLVFCIFCFYFQHCIAQCCGYTDNFSNKNGWTQIGKDVEISGGKVNFINYSRNGSGQKRIYKKLCKTLNSNDAWSTEIEFKPTAWLTKSGRPHTGAYLFALTAGNQEPFNNCPNLPCTGYPIGNQDGIMVIYVTKLNPTGQVWFKLKAKDGTTEYTSASQIIATPLNQATYPVIERVSSTLVRLSVYSNSAKTNHLTGSPITLTIPNTITGLNTMQFGSTVRGENRRGQNATIDNLTVKFNPKITGNHVIKSCSPIFWNGKKYSQSNYTAKDTLLTSYGCDSIVTLKYTRIANTTSTEVISACDSITWRNGIKYYTSNNTIADTVKNSNGCDSIINLHLTINKSTHVYDTRNSCEPIRWINGKTYSRSNSTAKHVLTNSVGCDSIIQLNLTIQPTKFSIDSINSCSSIKWIDGNTYTKNNYTAKHIMKTSSGCDSIITLNYTRFNKPTNFSLGNDTTLCEKTPITLSTPNQSATYNILWSNNSNTKSITTLNGGIIWATLSNICGTETDTIIVYRIQKPQIKVSPDTTICQGDKVVLEASVTNENPENVSFRWNSIKKGKSIKINTTSTNSVEVSNKCGTSTKLVNVTVAPQPILNIDRESILCDIEILFDFSTLDYDFLWSNGSSSPFFRTNEPGKFVVTVTNKFGCFLHQSFEVKPCPSRLWVPNAFSPNYDGINESFRAYKNDIKSYKIEIVNRWNNVVFSSKNIEEAWEGTLFNNPERECAQGNYVWKITYVEKSNNQTKVKYGVVSLIR